MLSRLGTWRGRSVRYGLAAGKAIERSATLGAARAQNPERTSTSADPKILVLPSTTWTNKPAEKRSKKPTRN